MGFFSDDCKAPREGTELPRKRGLPRLGELVIRDFMSFFKAGFLALLGAVPFIVGTILALYARQMVMAPAAGLAGGLIAGPQLCALADTILRSLRDEPGSWWKVYRRSWRRSARAALLPGALAGALLSTQIFLFVHAGALGITAPVEAALVAGFLLLTGLSTYLWPLLALMELLYWAVVIWFFPLAAPLLPFTSLWLPTLPAVLLIYPGIETAFRIEEKLRERQKSE